MLMKRFKLSDRSQREEEEDQSGPGRLTTRISSGVWPLGPALRVIERIETEAVKGTGSAQS